MDAPASATITHMKAAPHRAGFRPGFGLAASLAVLTLAGCASSREPGLIDKGLELVGLSKPALPEPSIKDLPQLATKVALRLHAGEVLNSDTAGRSLSVVARIYKLRDSAAFLQAPYEALRGDAKDSPFSQDVVEMREAVLTPGQHYEVVETMPLQAAFIAVVVLFRAPADARWRFAFATKPAAASGITLGVHGCALSVGQGQPVGAAPEVMRVAGVRCR